MPVYLKDIMSLDLLAKHIEDGVVRKQVHPQYPDTLYILNYSEQAQFGRIWDEVTNKCRGLIVAKQPEGADVVEIDPGFHDCAGTVKRRQRRGQAQDRHEDKHARTQHSSSTGLDSTVRL